MEEGPEVQGIVEEGGGPGPRACRCPQGSRDRAVKCGVAVTDAGRLCLSIPPLWDSQGSWGHTLQPQLPSWTEVHSNCAEDSVH